MKGWYNAVVDRAPPPTRVTLEQIMAERVDLYCHVQSLGDNIPISINPFKVEDLVPTEDEIDWAVRRICKNHSRGPSGMRTQHIKGWIEEARKAEAAAAAKAAEGAEESTRVPGE